MSLSRTHKAVLIQDIREFLEGIKPFLYPLLEGYVKENWFSEEDIIKWIISEEIELIYGLFDMTHIHNRFPHLTIYSSLRNSFYMALSEYVAGYIKAPRVYSDSEIRIEIRNGRDLLIHYYTMESIFKHQITPSW